MDDRDHHDTNVVNLRRRDDPGGRDRGQVASTIFAEQDEISTCLARQPRPAEPTTTATRPGDRGRDGSSLCCGLDPPPAQIPACTASALGSSLGFWRRTARRARDAGCGRAGAIEPRGGSSASS